MVTTFSLKKEVTKREILKEVQNTPHHPPNLQNKTLPRRHPFNPLFGQSIGHRVGRFILWVNTTIAAETVDSSIWIYHNPQLVCTVLCYWFLITWKLELAAGDGGIAQGSCSNRKESQPLKSRNAGLFLQNYFPTFPSKSEDACKEHSTSLAETVDACYKAAGNIMPNFLAVNFYMVLNISNLKILFMQFR